jgi:hypothetical protein
MERNPHEFIFEIDLAIRTQVVQKLEASPDLKLTRDAAPPLKGVYALYWKGELVYAGKALQTTLRKRLNEHHDKILDRQNISVKQMGCRFLTIESDWFVRAAEDGLNAYEGIQSLAGSVDFQQFEQAALSGPGIQSLAGSVDFQLQTINEAAKLMTVD